MQHVWPLAALCVRHPANTSRLKSEIPAQDVSAILSYIQTSFDLTPLPQDSAVIQADDTPTAEAPPAEATPVEVTPAEATPVEVTPAEGTPAEVTPPEVTPAEATPAEGTPSEATPAEAPMEGISDDESIHVPMGGAEDMTYEEMETDMMPVSANEEPAPTGDLADSSDKEMEMEMGMETGDPSPAHKSTRIDQTTHPIEPRRMSNLAQVVMETMTEVLLPDGPPSYSILPGASVRGRDLLSDGSGHTYSMCRETSKSIS